MIRSLGRAVIKLIIQGFETWRGKIKLYNEENKKDIEKFLRNLAILIMIGIVVLNIINQTGAYPWGSDTFGHLFKGNILYDAFKEGKLYLNYNENWYNGIQPFRYWAPLPYYVLAIINLFTRDIIVTYNVFVALVFIIGGLGWLCWGYYSKRQKLGLAFAILWFFVPDNLRVFFSEGNIPFVVVNTLIPYVLLFYYRALNEKKIFNYLGLTLLMSIITLSHAMISAMVGISLFMLSVINSIFNKEYAQSILVLIYAFLGTMLSLFWLYPALKGGILGLNKEAVASVMEGLTYPFTISLNPFLRFGSIEVYYFGLAFAITAIFGLLFSNKNERGLFVSALIVLLGTSKVTLPFLQKLPLNQLFWMRRFTSIAIAMILIALIFWKTLRKSVLFLLIIFLSIDSLASFDVLGFNRQAPLDLANIFDSASEIATQRVGVLDSSSFGSFPSYHISYNSTKGSRDQIFGWAWQGATTAENIVAINTALDNGYYELMLDRALELGADTLVVRKRFVTDSNRLEAAVKGVGYMKHEENEEVIIYRYPGVNRFSTQVNYDGITIGRYASNAIYLFPKLQTAKSEYLDEYTFEELRDRGVVYLSGFKFRNKSAAEELVLKLSRSGVKVIVDVTGFGSYDFLGVRAEPITINNNYQEIYYKDQRLEMGSFPQEYRSWRTYFLNGVENTESYGIIDYKIINYIGKKDNENLVFIGLNLPYYAFLTKDENALKILEAEFGLKLFEAPHRKIHGLELIRKENIIDIYSDSSDVIVPLAALDAFEKIEGDYEIINNLVFLKTPKLRVKIVYPYVVTGLILSILFVVITIGLSIIIKKKTKVKD